MEFVKCWHAMTILYFYRRPKMRLPLLIRMNEGNQEIKINYDFCRRPEAYTI